MSIDRDDYFEAMMNSAWNFKNDRVTAKGYAGKFWPKFDNQLLFLFLLNFDIISYLIL